MLVFDVLGVNELLTGREPEAVEEDVPELNASENWQFVRQDLDLMRFLIRANLNKADLSKREKFDATKWMQEIAKSCHRFFIIQLKKGGWGK